MYAIRSYYERVGVDRGGRAALPDLGEAGRLVTPDDIANAALFLCSPQADMIRGQVLVVDGGYTLVITSYSIHYTKLYEQVVTA